MARESGGHSKSGGVINNAQGKWKSKITMLDKEVRNHERQMLVILEHQQYVASINSSPQDVFEFIVGYLK